MRILYEEAIIVASTGSKNICLHKNLMLFSIVKLNIITKTQSLIEESLK